MFIREASTIHNPHPNPYINDFVCALERNGMSVGSPSRWNPLFGLLSPLKMKEGDAFIFHWLENVPGYKCGVLQTIAAVYLILLVKLCRKKLVWFLHNRRTHSEGGNQKYGERLLIWLLSHKADLIVTHASEGVEVAKRLCETAARHTVFLHHPTKNRIDEYLVGNARNPVAPDYDLLIWGSISRYKGVLEFARYATEHRLPYKIRIVGKCNKGIYEELKQYASDNISIEDRSISFEELARVIRTVRYVLIPYASGSVLSSGILMDSLSFGARVIGPDVGLFRDYAGNPLVDVETFRTFDDIPAILSRDATPIDMEGYRCFLNQYSWEQFGKIFCGMINQYSLSTV